MEGSHYYFYWLLESWNNSSSNEFSSLKILRFSKSLIKKKDFLSAYTTITHNLYSTFYKPDEKLQSFVQEDDRDIFSIHTVFFDLNFRLDSLKPVSKSEDKIISPLREYLKSLSFRNFLVFITLSYISLSMMK